MLRTLAAPIALIGLAVPAQGAGPGLPQALNDARWGERVAVDSGDWLNSISCPARRFCAAVDGGGHAFVRKRERWISYHRIDRQRGGLLVSVSCPGKLFCAAVDVLGNATTYDGHRWSKLVDMNLPRTLQVTCPSRTFCVAVNYNGLGAVFDGVSWSAPE